MMDIDSVIRKDACYRLLKNLIDLPNEKRLEVLEVGCGSGIRSLALKYEFRDYDIHVTLVDFSNQALALADKNAYKAGTPARLVLADVTKLPFLAGQFDIVWNEGVNEHFMGGARQLVFDEMARVCKPNGQVIIVVPNASNPFYVIWKFILQRQNRWPYGYEEPFTTRELRRKAIKSGLVPKKTGGAGILRSLSYVQEVLAHGQLAGSSGLRALIPGRLSTLIRRVEQTIERMMWRVGAYIGVRAIKCKE